MLVVGGETGLVILGTPATAIAVIGAGAYATNLAASSVIDLGHNLLLSQLSTPTVTIGPHGVTHALKLGLDPTATGELITSQIHEIAAQGTVQGEFWGRIIVGSRTIEYRAFGHPSGNISVGTYYEPRCP